MLIRINSHNYLDCSRMWTTNFDSHPTNSTVLFRASDWATFCPIPLQFLATTRNPFHHHRSTHQLHGVIQCSADEMARGNLKPNVIKLIRKCETTTTSRLHLKTHVGTHHVCVCEWLWLRWVYYEITLGTSAERKTGASGIKTWNLSHSNRFYCNFLHQ